MSRLSVVAVAVLVGAWTTAAFGQGDVLAYGFTSAPGGDGFAWPASPGAGGSGLLFNDSFHTPDGFVSFGNFQHNPTYFDSQYMAAGNSTLINGDAWWANPKLDVFGAAQMGVYFANTFEGSATEVSFDLTLAEAGRDAPTDLAIQAYDSTGREFFGYFDLAGQSDYFGRFNAGPAFGGFDGTEAHMTFRPDSFVDTRPDGDGQRFADITDLLIDLDDVATLGGTSEVAIDNVRIVGTGGRPPSLGYPTFGHDVTDENSPLYFSFDGSTGPPGTRKVPVDAANAAVQLYIQSQLAGGGNISASIATPLNGNLSGAVGEVVEQVLADQPHLFDSFFQFDPIGAVVGGLGTYLMSLTATIPESETNVEMVQRLLNEAAGNVRLQVFDENIAQWVNAVQLNSDGGNNSVFYYLSSEEFAEQYLDLTQGLGNALPDVLSSMGAAIISKDLESGTFYQLESWAVLDHFSLFGMAEVPEPASICVLAGLVGALATRRPMRRSPTGAAQGDLR